MTCTCEDCECGRHVYVMAYPDECIACHKRRGACSRCRLTAVVRVTNLDTNVRVDLCADHFGKFRRHLKKFAAPKVSDGD